MEKRSVSQLELFSQAKGYSQPEQRAGNTLFTYLHGYEKRIIIVICFMVTGIISFSLGVEKGKNLAAAKFNYRMNMANKIPPFEDKAATIPQRTVIYNNETQQTKNVLKIEAENYTIQVATYQTKRLAQQEADSLKKKGFLPLVLSRGKYNIVCVGTFSNKDKAKSLLPELKKRYRDCLVRRL